MKVLLIQPPHYYAGQSRKPAYFPLGLGYVAKALLSKGFEVEVLDIWAHQYSFGQALAELKVRNYDLVGISALVTQYAYVKRLVAEIKKVSRTPVILGGGLATVSYSTVLENSQVDVCVLGEGEETMPELVRNIDNPAEVRGIAFRENGKVVRTADRPRIKDLDALGLPEYGLFPVRRYLENCFVSYTSIHAMNVVSGRGCPYACNFCSLIYNGLALRSVESIIEEVKYIKSNFHVNGIFFNDNLLISGKKRGHEICEKIRPLNVKWSCQARANIVDRELLRDMKTSGCVAVGYGIESGSRKILGNMNKKINVEQSELAIKETLAAGLIPMVQLIFGYEGEDAGTVNDTVGLMDRAGFDIIEAQYSVLTPLPGTPLYDSVKARGLIKDEEKYLLGLEAGYNALEKEAIVNLTAFSDSEFWKARERAIQLINANYRKTVLRNPVKRVARLVFAFWLFASGIIFNRRYYVHYGFHGDAVKLIRKIIGRAGVGK